ncbi:MAG TPA: PIN domain-containing protein [Candidatus Nanoarchaeia archaeon]|nr:PIN domain-containing protein [Candidatus Nanoarchaeia archaeon]
MGNNYLIDSSVWIEYGIGSPLGERIKEILECGNAFTCLLSIAEISDKLSREGERFESFLRFIQKKSVVVNITIPSCAMAGELKKERRKSISSFGIIDALIYLTSQENKCMLVTKDRDFEGMKEVLLVKNS